MYVVHLKKGGGELAGWLPGASESLPVCLSVCLPASQPASKLAKILFTSENTHLDLTQSLLVELLCQVLEGEHVDSRATKTSKQQSEETGRNAPITQTPPGSFCSPAIHTGEPHHNTTLASEKKMWRKKKS